MPGSLDTQGVVNHDYPPHQTADTRRLTLASAQTRRRTRPRESDGRNARRPDTRHGNRQAVLHVGESSGRGDPSVQRGIEVKQPTPLSEVLQMYAYYSDGHTLQETADQFYLSPSGVRHVFQRHGFSRRTQRHAILLRHNTREETVAMYRDYCAGMTCKQIAAKYHYDDSTVEKRFIRYGLKMFRSPRYQQRRASA